MNNDILDADTPELYRAASELDRIADSLEAAIGRFERAAHIPTPARDEVSMAVAAAANSSATGFGADTNAGIAQIRAVAAVLRAQARGLIVADADVAGGFRG